MKKPVEFFGIDGEGRGRKRHKYVLLAACSASDKRFYVEHKSGLSTFKCLNFILDLPPYVQLFSYAFNYDITMMVADMPASSIYYLFHPELRQTNQGLAPVIYDKYQLNYLGTKFGVRRKGQKSWRHVWDIWKFFQCKFSKALEDWKVGENEVIAEIKGMKEKRGHFDRVKMGRIREYCFAECRYIAVLADRLTRTHAEIGLRLPSYYGPGSTATVLLGKLGIKEKRRHAPEAANHAVASAFFGGRFETSVIGPIQRRIYSYDISSAYPYQACLLPCLEHGEWFQTSRRKDLESCQTAIIRYELERPKKEKAWGPFPFRLKDGTVTFPIESGGGWVWKDEYLIGEELFNNVVFKEAWAFSSDCSCQPFDKIAEYYLERIRVGKDVKGIVLKLGYNSCYGKLAQSVGNPKFQSWIWAGIITAGCRAQILRALSLHRDWQNLLMIATDGVYTKEKLELPKPRETKGNDPYKPLGGWEETINDKGIFVARPGILFPLDPTKDEIAKVRARGLGRGVLFENWEKILESWKNHGITEDIVTNVVRFMGAKTSIHRVHDGEKYNFYRSREYGRWITTDFRLSLSPLPKRESMRPDGTLTLRSFPGLQSIPYSKALFIPKELQPQIDLTSHSDYSAQVEEQPDLDF